MPPDTLHINDIEVSPDRIRTVYNNIGNLADGIENVGLIQPIVLAAIEADGFGGVNKAIRFALDAGGRRHRALKLLFDEGRWDGILYHASTSTPGRPGFVLKGADESTPLKRLYTEIAENLDREDIDWRDKLGAVARAWRLAKAEGDAKGEFILQRDFGAMLGVNQADVSAANIVYDQLIAHPDWFKECTTIRNAYAALLKRQAVEVTKLQAAAALNMPIVQIQPESKQETTPNAPAESKPDIADVPVINLSQAFFNCDSFKFMAKQPDSCFDHIVTDPDYALSIDTLSANAVSFGSGVHQATPEESLNDYTNLGIQAWRLIKPQGFFIFFYDLDHHNVLQERMRDLGFAVQRWPLVWHKTDYRSNAAPSFNFAKNIEYAMVCRKPNAILARAQLSSIFSGPGAATVKEFHHPFAKPVELMTWIFSAIAIKGQTVYDPFAGSFAISCAAAQWGLRPVASEINPDHYANGLVNLQRYYRKLIGSNVNFK